MFGDEPVAAGLVGVNDVLPRPVGLLGVGDLMGDALKGLR